MRDPYTVLGVARTAKSQEIKSAFRKLAKKYHPDYNQDNPKAKEQFSEINQAYEILGDKDTRSKFDRGEIDAEGKPSAYGFQQGDSHPFRGFSYREPNGNNQFHSGGDFNIDDSILHDLFGRGNSGFGNFSFDDHKQKQRRGADISAALSVSLEQIVSSEKIEVLFANSKRLKIKLPTFVEDGQVIRLKGQGQAAPGTIAGDALITIRLLPHPRFRLEGRALHLDVPVSLKTAILGGKQKIETLDGQVSVRIPPWSSSDLVLRLKDKGLPLKDGSRAPLYIHIRIMLPQYHDPELETLMKNYPD